MEQKKQRSYLIINVEEVESAQPTRSIIIVIFHCFFYFLFRFHVRMMYFYYINKFIRSIFSSFVCFILFFCSSPCLAFLSFCYSKGNYPETISIYFNVCAIKINKMPSRCLLLLHFFPHLLFSLSLSLLFSTLIRLLFLLFFFFLLPSFGKWYKYLMYFVLYISFFGLMFGHSCYCCRYYLLLLLLLLLFWQLLLLLLSELSYAWDMILLKERSRCGWVVGWFSVEEVFLYCIYISSVVLLLSRHFYSIYLIYILLLYSALRSSHRRIYTPRTVPGSHHRRRHPVTRRKKSTFINLPRDICAHNFRDPAIKLRPKRELGVGYTISRYFICCLILSI